MEQPNNLIKSFPSSFTTHNPLLSFFYIDYFIAVYRRLIRIVQSTKTNWNVVLFEKVCYARMSRAVVDEKNSENFFLFHAMTFLSFFLSLSRKISLGKFSYSFSLLLLLFGLLVVAWGSWTQHNSKKRKKWFFRVFHYRCCTKENIVCRHACNFRSLPLLVLQLDTWYSINSRKIELKINSEKFPDFPRNWIDEFFFGFRCYHDLTHMQLKDPKFFRVILTFWKLG